MAVELGVSRLSAGGLLVGGASRHGFVLGLSLDYLSTSLETGSESTRNTATTSTTRFGFGARLPVLRTPDGSGELIAAADVAFALSRAVDTSSTTGSSSSTELTGYSWAFGPGLRLWVLDQMAIGFLGRIRRTVVSSDDDFSPVKAEESALESTFFALGVF